MFSTLFSIALLALPALADFAVSSRPINQCETTKISWQPAKGPYDLIIVPAANPCSEALVEQTNLGTTVIEWKNTVIPAGTVVQISIADVDGEEAWSQNITVGAGSSDCLPKASASSTASGSTATKSLTGSTGSGSGSSSTGSDDSTGGEIAAVGAANAGSNKAFGSNSAFSAHQISLPLLALTAITAGFTLAL